MCRRLTYRVVSIVVLGLALTSVSSADLIGWWQLNEGFLNTFHDSSGYGHDGTIDPPNLNKVQWSTGGYKGGCLQFPDSLAPFTLCDAPITPGLLNIESATSAFWMSMPAVYQEWGIAFILLGENADHSIEPTDVRGILAADFADDGSTWAGYDDMISTIPITADEWHHVAVTYSADANAAVLYFDAVEVNAISFGSHDPILSARIGGPRDRVQWRSFIGKIDEAVVYNEALSSEQVQSLFLYGPRPTPKASNPQPLDGATDVPLTAALGWDAGIYADKHDVYIGTVFDDVNAASRADPRGVLVSEDQTRTTHISASPLAYGQTYYWRIDEINDVNPASPWHGDIWSFTAANFLVVDDFESYTDTEPNRIFDKWIDGWAVEENGAVVGHAAPDFDAGEHFAETAIFYTGRQSMPFFYDTDFKYSQAELALSGSASDWTREGVESLRLWFRGYPKATTSFVENPAGTFTIVGAGTDIWDRADQCHFAFKELTGAVSIITKVTNVENVNEWVKAGLMIRDSLDPGSANVCLVVTPAQGVRFQYRTVADGTTDRQFVEGIAAPEWLKLERTSGGLVRAYYSADGTKWTQFNLQMLSASGSVYVGLVVTSHDAALTAKGEFTNVTITGTGSDKPWTAQDIGIVTNIAEPIYVALNDKAVVYHDDPNATLIDTWTQWSIPLQEFAGQGVNLANVSEIALGVGTKGDATTPGGSGILYFDDIRLYRPDAGQ
jgi:hypothetical protein